MPQVRQKTWSVVVILLDAVSRMGQPAYRTHCEPCCEWSFALQVRISWIFFLPLGFLVFWILKCVKNVSAGYLIWALLSGGLIATSSFYPSIGVPDRSERVSYWADLYVAMDDVPMFKTVFTDPVTGYLINGLTSKNFDGYKFLGGPGSELSIENYVGEALNKKRGTYLVINLRNGGGRFSGITKHWSDEELKVSRFYTSNFLNYIFSESTTFVEKWVSDDHKIFIFLVR